MTSSFASSSPTTIRFSWTHSRLILGIESEIEVAGRAHDGEEATRLAGDLVPDVVLMDLSMPVLDGFEASRRIRAKAPATAVVVLTGSSYAEDVEKAYDAGASGYVTKDRIAQDLVRTVLGAVN
jgi:DNA-binding NarL/FixJ family response regulator